MIKTHGLDHVTLTVSDLIKTKKFYEDIFDVELTPHKEGSFNLLPVGIHCWFVVRKEPILNDRFDEKRIGLDHLAFKLKSITELKIIVERLKKLKVPTAGLQFYNDKYPYVCFRDPDNIQMEFFISDVTDYKYCAAIIIKNKKILLLKRSQEEKDESGKWNPVNETIEKGETPEETVIRGVKEEIGMQFKITKQLPDHDFDGLTAVFLGTVTGKIKIDKRESSQYDWFSYRKCRTLDFAYGYERIIESLHKLKLI